MIKVKKTFQQLTSSDVCEIYNVLHTQGHVSFGITPEGVSKVESLVQSINGHYFGVTLYGTCEERAIAYLYFIIKDHPFVDGNKRMSCLSFLSVCELNSLEPNIVGFTLDELAVFIEQQKVDDHHRFIKRTAQLLFGDVAEQK